MQTERRVIAVLRIQLSQCTFPTCATALLPASHKQNINTPVKLAQVIRTRVCALLPALNSRQAFQNSTGTLLAIVDAADSNCSHETVTTALLQSGRVQRALSMVLHKYGGLTQSEVSLWCPVPARLLWTFGRPAKDD